MLHEAEEPLLGRLALKVQDPRLGHTLSRDNVRRDERFTHAVTFARELAERQLPAAAAAALREAAILEDRARYHALAAAIGAAGVELRASEWWFPLVEPVDGERAISGAALGKRAWSAPARSPLTTALAAAGVPVLHEGGSATMDRAAHLGCRVVPLIGELTSVAIVEPAPNDLALLGELHALLAATHRAPSQIVLGSLAGAFAGQLAVAAGPEDAVHAQAAPVAPFVIDLATAGRSPFGMLRRPPLVLSVGHPLVSAVRLHPDPVLAASILARAVLLHYRLLDVERSETILARTLDRLGVA